MRERDIVQTDEGGGIEFSMVNSDKRGSVNQREHRGGGKNEYPIPDRYQTLQLFPLGDDDGTIAKSKERSRECKESIKRRAWRMVESQFDFFQSQCVTDFDCSSLAQEKFWVCCTLHIHILVSILYEIISNILCA